MRLTRRVHIGKILAAASGIAPLKAAPPRRRIARPPSVTATGLKTSRAAQTLLAALSDQPCDIELIDTTWRGWSRNTRRAFLSDLAFWLELCRDLEITPLAATEEIVVDLLRHCSAPYLVDEDGAPRLAANGARIINPAYGWKSARMVRRYTEKLSIRSAWP